MQKAKLHIISKTTDKDGASNLEQRVVGELAEKDGSYYFFYEETAEGMQGTKTTLKWGQDFLIINRSGTIENRQEFREGQRCQSVYKTPYLQIPLVSNTKKLQIETKGIKHHLDVVYDLQYGEEPYGKMEIVMDLEEQNEY